LGKTKLPAGKALLKIRPWKHRDGAKRETFSKKGEKGVNARNPATFEASRAGDQVEAPSPGGKKLEGWDDASVHRHLNRVMNLETSGRRLPVGERGDKDYL